MKTNCSTHGKSASSTICGHLLNNKNESLGFVENSAIKGDFQGWCYACESLFLKEEDKTEKFKAFTNMTVVCEACYVDIKKQHSKIDLLELSWTQREVEIYPLLFGKMPKDIMPLDALLFKNQFKHERVDPSWLFNGVFEVEPNEQRKSWLYVTSGMSNIWETDKPETYAGYGVELMIECKEKSPWAVHMLRSLMAFNIMLAIGKYGDKPLLDYGDRIPHKINDRMCSVMIVKPMDFPEYIELKSGRVDLLQLVTISNDELAYAKEYSSDALSEKMREAFGTYVVDLEREDS